MSETLEHYAKQMEPDKWYTCHDLKPYKVHPGYQAHIVVSTALSHIYADMPTKLKRRIHVKDPLSSSKVRFEYALNNDPGKEFRIVHEHKLNGSQEETMQLRRIQKGVHGSGFRTLIQELEDLPKGFEIVIRRT